MTSPPRPVYTKSNPAGGASLPPGKKRLLIIICAVVVALAAGGSIWGAVAADQFSSSANGCVNVNLAGSMGGELVHKCGSDARAYCRAAYGRSDTAGRDIQAQCVKAGLTRQAVGA